MIGWDSNLLSPLARLSRHPPLHTRLQVTQHRTAIGWDSNLLSPLAAAGAAPGAAAFTKRNYVCATSVRTGRLRRVPRCPTLTPIALLNAGPHAIMTIETIDN